MSTASGDHLVFPEFNDIEVSTKTFVAATNLKIDIYKLFRRLPVTPYTVVPKKRGRKKKVVQEDPNQDILPGSIISLSCEEETRGVVLKKKKKRENGSDSTQYFRNAMSVVIILDKKINFKICKNGTFQLTGCKSRTHADQCVETIWDLIREEKDIYEYRYGTEFCVIYVPSMRNIDFPLGFTVDREKLKMYMYSEHNTHCILEPSFGYTGVNIKFSLKENILDMHLTKKTYKNGHWKTSLVKYRDYIETLTPKDAKAKLAKKRYLTFLVFHSGKVIMSGVTAEYKKPVYYEFLDIIKQGYDQIEERLDTW